MAATPWERVVIKPRSIRRWAMGGAAVAAFAVVATVIGTAGAAPVPAKAKTWNPPRNVKQLDFVGGKTAPGVIPDSYIVILKNHPSVTSTNTTTAESDPPKVGTGHGTHVAGRSGGTNFGVDKNGQIVAVRVIRCNGSGDEVTIAAGIDWVTKNAVKPAVANLSIGGDPSTLIDTAVRNSIVAGITYSIAAGNGDPVRHVGIDACTQSPSDVTEAIVASATDEGDVRAPFANFGNCVSVFAPGLDVVSAWFGDNT